MKDPANTGINCLEDLHAEMRQVKMRIKARETDLVNRWNRLPEEAVKASVIAILPAFMGNQLASGVWKLLKGTYGLFKGKDDGNDNTWKDTLTSGAKQAGLFSMLKLLFSVWKGR